MIHVEGLHKRFGKLTVLDGLDLDVEEGGIFAVLGPNGSGKTTLIKCILGMVVPDRGDVRIAGESVLGQWQYRRNLNYLPQIANFPANLTVAELIAMVKDLRSAPSREDELVALFGLEPFLNKKLGHLSGGTKQKVNLVLAFMFDGAFIVLDEPTTGLDPVALLHLKDLIRAQKAAGKTILITTHIMSFVEQMVDEIVFLLDGKIYFRGSISALKEKTQAADLEHAIAALMSA